MVYGTTRELRIFQDASDNMDSGDKRWREREREGVRIELFWVGRGIDARYTTRGRHDEGDARIASPTTLLACFELSTG